jgi:hypothetical protein
MTDDPTTALRLLDEIERPAASVPSVVLARPSEVGIFWGADQLAKSAKLRAERWPRYIQGDPAAIEAWERDAVKVQAWQRELAKSQPLSINPAERDSEAAVTSRKIELRR